MSKWSVLFEARKSFHKDLFDGLLRIDRQGIPNNADKDSPLSVNIGKKVLEKIKENAKVGYLPGQSTGANFEKICSNFVKNTFGKLTHLRPGAWEIGKIEGGRLAISKYDQYEHLASLEDLASKNPELKAALGSDYFIKPDVVIVRLPEPDAIINEEIYFADENVARKTPLRRINSDLPILHASISCKWTLRSDRAQNARSEALNLVRNRKGKLPHIVVITGEPLPSRLASISLGTGDIDCVYHFALHELVESIDELKAQDAREMLDVMINGKRLRDISDLPLDLAI